MKYLFSLIFVLLIGKLVCAQTKSVATFIKSKKEIRIEKPTGSGVKFETSFKNDKHTSAWLIIFKGEDYCVKKIISNKSLEIAAADFDYIVFTHRKKTIIRHRQKLKEVKDKSGPKDTTNRKELKSGNSSTTTTTTISAL